jgi:quercetin dioxygenase-like cupin family protein
MAFLQLRDVTPHEPAPGFAGRFVHSESLTAGYWEIREGATLPEHRHPQEMIVTILEGSFEIVVDGVARTLEPGVVAVIPSGVPHGGRAITACRILDVWSPPRTDYPGWRSPG